jgi:Outer membrane protein beta-barrel domain
MNNQQRTKRKRRSEHRHNNDQEPMNKQLLTLSAALLGSLGLMAQSKQVSLGLDLGLPLDPLSKEYTLLVGPSAGFELPIGDNLGITLNISYLLPQAKSDFKEVLSSATLLPIQAGVKYYFTESQNGFYGHAQIGVHSFSESFKAIDVAGIHVADAETKSETNLSWAIGAGYQLEKFDIGLRYNMIMAGEAEAGAETEPKSYIGLRVAYLLSLGGN